MHYLRVLRGVATSYRIQTERPRLRAFVLQNHVHYCFSLLYTTNIQYEHLLVNSI